MIIMHSCGINNNWLMFHVEQINKSRKMFYVEQSRGEQKRALRPFEAVEKVAFSHFFDTLTRVNGMSHLLENLLPYFYHEHGRHQPARLGPDLRYEPQAGMLANQLLEQSVFHGVQYCHAAPAEPFGKVF